MYFCNFYDSCNFVCFYEYFKYFVYKFIMLNIKIYLCNSCNFVCESFFLTFDKNIKKNHFFNKYIMFNTL